MSEFFPSDWDSKRLNELGESYSGLKIKTKADFTDEGNAKFVTYRNINKNYFIDENDLSPVVVEESENQNAVIKGDVLFTGSSETPEEVAFSSVMKQSFKDLYLNSFSFGYRFNNEHKIEPEFYAYYFRGNFFRKVVLPLAQGSTRYNISRNELLKLHVPIPPIKEQQKIAAILSSVDEAIEKTEQIIEQTETVKKGLMQELLTKGIGHTEFKDTLIGEIPVSWDVKNIEDVANTMSGGTPKRNRSDYYIGDIPWIKTGELKDKYLYETEECISELAIQESSAKLIPINSVIIAMYGATIGNLTINKIEATSNQACCSIQPNSKLLHFEFLYYTLSFYKEKIIRMGAGGAQPNISQQLVKKLSIPIPSLSEQEEIVNILNLYDIKLEKSINKKSQLFIIKQGLMQQLLTGKVRVKVDDSEGVNS